MPTSHPKKEVRRRQINKSTFPYSYSLHVGVQLQTVTTPVYSQRKKLNMVELNSLNLQLENLKVLYEAAVSKDFSIQTVKLISAQIKQVEKAVESRKEKLKT